MVPVAMEIMYDKKIVPERHCGIMDGMARDRMIEEECTILIE